MKAEYPDEYRQPASGYSMLAAAVCKQAYEDMVSSAKAYYALTLPYDQLTTLGQHLHGDDALDGRIPDLNENIVRHRKRFNKVASWCAYGLMSEWFSEELGLYLIGQAKREARRKVCKGGAK